MLCAVNSALHRQRRRAVTFMAALVLAGTVVSAHSVLNHDHMGDAIVACLAVVETAVAAVGATLALATRGPRFRVAGGHVPLVPALVEAPAGNARAGPQLLQVFRL